MRHSTHSAVRRMLATHKHVIFYRLRQKKGKKSMRNPFDLLTLYTRKVRISIKNKQKQKERIWYRVGSSAKSHTSVQERKD